MKATRSLWIHLSAKADHEAVVSLVEALNVHYPRVETLLTVGQEAARTTLARRLPKAIVMAPPKALAIAVDRRLNRLDVRLLILAAPGDPLDPLLLNRAARRAVPGVALHGWSDREAPAEFPIDELELIYARAGASPLPSTAEAKLLHADGTAGTGDSWAALMTALAPLLARDLKLARSRGRGLRRAFEGWLARRLEDGWLRRCLGRRWSRYDSLEALNQALGNPDTILCLGNGPSSEDPDLKELSYDCLFRVNHLWRERGFITEAQMVFCGSKVTLARIPEAIFGLQTIESERRLLGYLIMRVLKGRTARYAALERYSLFFTEPEWSHIRPTNGASMLATAVALQPKRLVISGIDLFSHPAGSYPGDSSTPNAYTPGHQPDSELALLLEALRAYRGELVILSEALAREWQLCKKG